MMDRNKTNGIRNEQLVLGWEFIKGSKKVRKKKTRTRSRKKERKYALGQESDQEK